MSECFPRVDRHQFSRKSLRSYLEAAREEVAGHLLPVLAAFPALDRGAADYTFDVKYYGGDHAGLDEVLEHTNRDVAASDAFSLYLHFPLCPYVCRFCHYHVRAHTGRSGGTEAVLSGLEACAELALAQVPALAERSVSSIYLGGGTPSLLSPVELDRVFGGLRQRFDVTRVEEITLETTPDTATPEWLAAVAERGVTRVSSGVQILDDGVLEFRGRRHTVADVRRFAAACRQLPGVVFNLDLIVGLPGVSAESWLDSVARLAAEEPDSITIYRLRLGRSDERPSALTRLWRRQPELFPDAVAVAVQLLAARTLLTERGYREGPIGWFWRGAGSPRCYRDRWRLQRPLIGLGESAYSYGASWQLINCKSARFRAALPLGRWPAEVTTLLTVEETRLRRAAWWLRATGEMPAANRSECSHLARAATLLEAHHLAERDGEQDEVLRLTPVGTLLIDEIIREYLHLRAWDEGEAHRELELSAPLPGGSSPWPEGRVPLPA